MKILQKSGEKSTLVWANVYRSAKLFDSGKIIFPAARVAVGKFLARAK
jgi:hypothetical protein